MAINLINTQKNISDGSIPETILVAIVTATAYVGAFVYKMAYLSFYKINLSFVDVDLQDILSINLLILMLFVEISYFMVHIFINKKRNNGKRKWLFMLLLFLLLFAPFLSEIFIKSNYVLVVIIFFSLLFIFIGKRKYSKIKSKNPLELIKSKFGIFPILVFLVTVLYCCYCYTSGLFAARTQDKYFVVENQNIYLVVIASYDKSFLCLPFNFEQKTFSDNLMLLTQDKISDNNLSFINKKIGPLKYQKNVN
jgi:hypothetical protein